MKHIISASQFQNRQELEKLFTSADEFEKSSIGPPATQADLPVSAKHWQAGLARRCGRDKILASLFFEPSTRTRFSFESAMLRLGGQVISAENAFDNSSAKKGETLEDTIRVVSGYADCIVLRHPEKGSAQRAAQVSTVPIINAGDGSGEHPTQALVDVYTMQKELGKIDGLHIALVGDLLYGRTVHSLSQLLCLWPNVRIILVSPLQLQMPQEYTQYLQSHGISFQETNDFFGALKKADVVYMTRIQKERFSSQAAYENLKSSYILDEHSLSYLSKNALILHPLPRVDEIAPTVDSDPRAAYFRQSHNGVWLRMSLLQSIVASI